MKEEAIKLEKTCEPFVVMAKPVGSRCNMKCGYCYYLETGRFNKSTDQLRMTDALLENFIRQYIEASPGPVIQFTWHGGEPTLAGLDFYRLVVKLQRRYLPEGWACWNNLQTNGILLDDEWCSFLADEKFDVGLSIDGTEWLHNEYRKDHGGKGTYERAVYAVRRLQAHGIQPDLLCTVTSSIAKEPSAVYQALKGLGTGWIQFIPIVRRSEEGRVTPDSVTAEDYGQFLSDVFDEWVYHDLGSLDVQMFAEVSLVLSGGSSNPCWMAPTCGRVLVVEQDGGVYSCDHFVNLEHKIGDIYASNLRELVDSSLQRSFGSSKRENLTAQCRSCRWLSICNGGCLKERFVLTEDGEAGLNYLCSGYMSFFAYAVPILKRVNELRKSGMNPAAVMDELREELQARWKGIGRNDPCPCGSGRKAKLCCWQRRP